MFGDKLKLGNVVDVSAMRWTKPQAVGQHVDDLELGATICVMTLRCKYTTSKADKACPGSYVLDLYGPQKETRTVRIRKNEIYFLSGASRYKWAHGLGCVRMALKDTVRLFMPYFDVRSAIATAEVPSDMRLEQ